VGGMSVSQESLGKQIKAAREAKGWSQEYLGNLCGVRKSQISKVERDVNHASMALFLRICEVFGFETVIQMQQDLKDEAIKVLHEKIWISFPYTENSINKVTFVVKDSYIDLMILPNNGLLFSEENIIFTKDKQLPVLSDKQIQSMVQAKEDHTTAKLVISIPYKTDSIKQVSHCIVGNYFHLVLYGKLRSTFDKSKVKFTRFQQ
jgi:transcriptional regulator with XRE-family HTH domain